MSRLEELIAELCPDGVDRVPIGSLITRVRERGKDDLSVTQVYVVSNTLGLVKAEDYRENTIHSEDTSNYTIVRRNMVAYNPSRLNIGSIALLRGSDSGLVSPMYVVFSIDLGRVDPNYFELIIKSSYVASKIDSLKEEGARFRFDFERWNWIEIQLPPLPIQTEIVKIVSKFSELGKTLKAELTARKKQYEYYLNDILSPCETIPELSLKELCVFIRNGLTYKADKDRSRMYKVSRIETISNGKINLEKTATVDHIVKEYRLIEGDILFSHINSMSWLGNTAYYQEEFGELYHGMNLLCFRADQRIVLPKYLFYIMHTRFFRRYVVRYAKQAINQASLSISEIEKWRIPVPTIPEQREIVKKIDKFDELLTDITNGLPAEITKRQQQYEYYRDQLLTFSEKMNEVTA